MRIIEEANDSSCTEHEEDGDPPGSPRKTRITTMGSPFIPRLKNKRNPVSLKHTVTDSAVNRMIK